jgi:hypothetical protein
LGGEADERDFANHAGTARILACSQAIFISGAQAFYQQ